MNAFLSIYIYIYIDLSKLSRQNKPYLVPADDSKSVWNFNVSHHGEFVGIAWHENYLVGSKCLTYHAIYTSQIGIDIVDINTRVNWVNSFESFLDIYRRQLSDAEIESIYK